MRKLLAVLAFISTEAFAANSCVITAPNCALPQYQGVFNDAFAAAIISPTTCQGRAAYYSGICKGPASSQHLVDGVASNYTAAGGQAVYSSLWGVTGEKWSISTSRLMDWSFAGYRFGEEAIPNDIDPAHIHSVMDFGAVGDGIANDGPAIQTAINNAGASVGGKHIAYLPPGTYRIAEQRDANGVVTFTGRLFYDISVTNHKGFILRGAGKDLTTLKFETSLATIFPTDTTFSQGGGLIVVKYYDGVLHDIDSWTRAATVISDQPRGKFTLKLGGYDPADFPVGREVRVVMYNINKYVDLNIYGGFQDLTLTTDGNQNCNNNKCDLFRFTARVVSLVGNVLTLDRAMPLNIEVRAQAEIHFVRNTPTPVGIENFTMEFPDLPYQTHWENSGFNGIQFAHINHSWIKNIRFKNANFGVQLSYSSFNTLDGLEFSHGPNKITGAMTGKMGHHGIYFQRGANDNLVSNFRFNGLYMHDLTVGLGAMGNVFMDGSGEDLCLDHHAFSPHNNLFTNIDAGLGTRPFLSGARGGTTGAQTGQYMTVWNMVAAQAMALPLNVPEPGINPATAKPSFGPLLNIMGFKATPGVLGNANTYLWNVQGSGQTVQPLNLYRAQKAKRLGN